jgi:hypothetical protein
MFALVSLAVGLRPTRSRFPKKPKKEILVFAVIYFVCVLPSPNLAAVDPITVKRTPFGACESYIDEFRAEKYN